MADITTTKTTLKIENHFADDTSDTLIIDSVNSSVDAAQIGELNSFMLQNQIILSKNGAAFTGIKQAKTSDDTKTVLDIS